MKGFEETDFEVGSVNFSRTKRTLDRSNSAAHGVCHSLCVSKQKRAAGRQITNEITRKDFE